MSLSGLEKTVVLLVSNIPSLPLAVPFPTVIILLWILLLPTSVVSKTWVSGSFM